MVGTVLSVLCLFARLILGTTLEVDSTLIPILNHEENEPRSGESLDHTHSN